ncbi:uncharacterized protein LOC125941027 [Dermacentor silvarum]|uniref:uncharacterized protein LOC125941027 n=1 Tax=Dermacentor silvarum TaxID=543639 RepID=UPI002101222B|nr:uncharacterized protein LOC125941027 [Dermacentor silvarum]
MWKKPLLCSFEATMSPDLVFPDDGVCDISFFQAHEENHTLLRGEESEYDAAFDAFVKAAAKQTITEHGVSLDCHNYNNSAEAMKEPASTKTIKELWGKKMYHWASMNTYLAVAKEMLITLYHVMKRNATGNPARDLGFGNKALLALSELGGWSLRLPTHEWAVWKGRVGEGG